MKILNVNFKPLAKTLYFLLKDRRIDKRWDLKNWKITVSNDKYTKKLGGVYD